MDEMLRRLEERRKNLIENARESLERAEAEGRDLEGDALTTYENTINEARKVMKRIDEVREMIAFEEAAEETRQTLEGLEQRGTKDREREQRGGNVLLPDDEEFRSFLLGNEGNVLEMRFEERNLYTGATGAADTQGAANTIAETFVANLYEALRETSIARELAQRIVTSGGEKMTFPKVVGRAQASRVDEGQTIPKSDPQFDKQQLEAFKYGFISMVSTELVEDTAVNLVPFLVSSGREALGEAQAEDFMVGDGTNGPQGMIPGATIVQTAASGSALTFDELLDLKFAVKRGYRRNGLYVVSDSSVNALAKITDADGNYAWKTSSREGEPDTIHGKRVEVDPHVPEIGLSNRSVLFVDPARAYLIRDIGNVRVNRSDEYGYDTDEIAWRFLTRCDGGVWDDNALAVIEHPAT